MAKFELTWDLSQDEGEDFDKDAHYSSMGLGMKGYANLCKSFKVKIRVGKFKTDKGDRVYITNDTLLALFKKMGTAMTIKEDD